MNLVIKQIKDKSGQLYDLQDARVDNLIIPSKLSDLEGYSDVVVKTTPLLKINGVEYTQGSEVTISDSTWNNDKDNYYTISLINNLLSGLIKQKIITSKDEITESSIIYLLRNTNTEGEDLYEEYILANGNIELLGTTKTISDSISADSVEDKTEYGDVF